MGPTLLSEGLTDFWLCESVDSLLPISGWITGILGLSQLHCSPIDTYKLLAASKSTFTLV